MPDAESLPHETTSLLGGAGAGRHDEDTALKSRRWVDRLRHNVAPDDLVIPLMIITFSTSAMDVATLQTFGTYTTNQTGNTVFIALSLLSLGRVPLRPALVSLIGFLGCGLIMGQTGIRIGARTIGWLLFSLLVQTVSLLLATVLVCPLGPASFYAGGPNQWVLVLLTAISGGTQIAMASSVGVPELPTGMMTTPYARLISEPNLLNWRIKDVARDRRAVYVLVFWAGAFTGAALERWISSWLTFGLGVGCKALAMGMVFMAKEEGSRG
ncbi:hypothetical protein EHS25_009872 [Saitozyma podzolica]|uniref:DUF1275 domain protein n=1 Tax=Saitozyma podzolica TaxID=1890683 RepID=A0A427YKE4_9TREE|nr:hypothetical protein EHS25_009872 [Saitozyma podzolica]